MTIKIGNRLALGNAKATFKPSVNCYLLEFTDIGVKVALACCIVHHAEARF